LRIVVDIISIIEGENETGTWLGIRFRWKIRFIYNRLWGMCWVTVGGASKIVDILIRSLEALGYESLPLSEEQKRNVAYSTRLLPYARSIQNSISHSEI